MRFRIKMNKEDNCYLKNKSFNIPITKKIDKEFYFKMALDYIKNNINSFFIPGDYVAIGNLIQGNTIKEIFIASHSCFNCGGYINVHTKTEAITAPFLNNKLGKHNEI